MDSDSVWAQSAQQFQQIFGDSWSRAVQQGQLGQAGPLATTAAMPKVEFSAEKLKTLQEQYFEQARQLWSSQGLPATSTPLPDKRFSAEAWGSNPVAALSAATYLLNARTLMGLDDAVEAD